MTPLGVSRRGVGGRLDGRPGSLACRSLGVLRGRGYRCGMEQRLSCVTLGVADLGPSRAFYEALGWSGQVLEDGRTLLGGP